MAYPYLRDQTRSRGKPVKTYDVVYRATVRTKDGRPVTRPRQETHSAKGRSRSRDGRIEFPSA